MNGAFFCGAGTSIPAGMPSTGDITETLLSNTNFHRHTDSNYYPGPPQLSYFDSDVDVERVCAFLGVLKEVCDNFFRPWSGNEAEYVELFGEHETNYEDLYYIASQLHDSAVMEHENPALAPLVCTLNSKADRMGLFSDEHSVIGHIRNFDELVRETVNYLECVIWEALGGVPQPTVCPHPLAVIGQAADDPDVGVLDLYTLNHDRVLDTFLSGRCTQFVDGFGIPEDGVRYWEPECFRSKTAKVRVIKLHGSVNWFSFCEAGVAIPVDGDPDHLRGRDGRLLTPWPSRPLMLIGTFNKMLQYHYGGFAELYHLFYENLRHADHVVVCGYGFGDKAINVRLLDWAETSGKMVVIDPDCRRLKKTARGAFRKSCNRLEEQGRVVFIAKKVEEVSWTDVKKVFAP